MLKACYSMIYSHLWWWRNDTTLFVQFWLGLAISRHTSDMKTNAGNVQHCRRVNEKMFDLHVCQCVMPRYVVVYVVLCVVMLCQTVSIVQWLSFTNQSKAVWHEDRCKECVQWRKWDNGGYAIMPFHSMHTASAVSSNYLSRNMLLQQTCLTISQTDPDCSYANIPYKWDNCFKSPKKFSQQIVTRFLLWNKSILLVF